MLSRGFLFSNVTYSQYYYFYFYKNDNISQIFIIKLHNSLKNNNNENKIEFKYFFTAIIPFI